MVSFFANRLSPRGSPPLRSVDYCLSNSRVLVLSHKGTIISATKKHRIAVFFFVIDKLLVVVYWLIKITGYIQSIYRVRWDTMRIGNE